MGQHFTDMLDSILTLHRFLRRSELARTGTTMGVKVGGAYGEQSGSGVMTGMVNQKVEPTAGLETAPIWPPNTATCLLQMLRPRPVPPARLGRFISSSVPCSHMTA